MLITSVKYVEKEDKNFLDIAFIEPSKGSAFIESKYKDPALDSEPSGSFVNALRALKEDVLKLCLLEDYQENFTLRGLSFKYTNDDEDEEGNPIDQEIKKVTFKATKILGEGVPLNLNPSFKYSVLSEQQQKKVEKLIKETQKYIEGERKYKQTSLFKSKQEDPQAA